MQPVPRWEHFEHMADIGVRGVGVTPAEAFEQVGLALTAVVTSPERIRPVQAVAIRCSGDNVELLLFDWINALVYEMANRGMLFGRYEVRIDNGRLQGRAWGEPTDRRRHEPAVEIKGATMTALDVRRDESGHWLAQCVVDV